MEFKGWVGGVRTFFTYKNQVKKTSNKVAFVIPWVKEDTYSSRYKEMVYEYTIQIQYAPGPPPPPPPVEPLQRKLPLPKVTSSPVTLAGAAGLGRPPVVCPSPTCPHIHSSMPSRRWMWVRPTPHIYSYNREILPALSASSLSSASFSGSSLSASQQTSRYRL